MSSLLLLWWSSLTLGAGAVLLMVVLIVRHAARARADGTCALERKRIVTAITGLLGGDETAAAELQACTRRPWLLVETALEFLNLVRGADQDRLKAALAGMRLDPKSRSARSSRAARLSAVEALVFFPGPATVTTLRGALRDRDPAVQASALRSLVLLGAAPPLSELLSDEGARWGGSRLFADIVTLIARERPGEVRDALGLTGLTDPLRLVLLEALGAAGDYAALPLLSDALSDGSAAVRAAAVRALGALAHPAAAPVLRLALTDAAWSVRADAAAAIGRGGLAALAPALRERLTDEAWWVRFRAGEALAALGQPLDDLPAAGGAPLLARAG